MLYSVNGIYDCCLVAVDKWMGDLCQSSAALAMTFLRQDIHHIHLLPCFASVLFLIHV